MVKNYRKRIYLTIGIPLALGVIILSFSTLQSTRGSLTPQFSVVQSSGKDSSKGTIAPMIKRKLAEGKKPNRLIKEKSPYLLQHAFNPVDWYSWGEEAFKKARAEKKPIFLSIGYSTCYWCHVMEREVFENDSIAAIMNKYVVSIKVDREERPDVDRVYMTALQAATGGGGWPMSMFLTPDLKPFYGGTYIPPFASHGRPGFADLVARIHEAWTSNPDQLRETSQRLADLLIQISAPETKATAAEKTALENGFNTFSKSYDEAYAGFGGAPKFPRPVVLNFLLRYYSRTGDKKALSMALETLKQMANGGMYDHIGSGFHRYSTDERWHVPHFEKMLYDQAQLAISYVEAYQISHDEFFSGAAKEILAYVQRQMTHPEGAFYSAEDAESVVDPSKPEEKKEGAFYIWKKTEIEKALSSEYARLFEFVYGIEEGGNVSQDPRNEFSGENILYVSKDLEETARQFHLSVEKVRSSLDAARRKLYRAREARPQPHLDDKVLVSWNGLMISAFAKAHQVLEDNNYLTSAVRASDFLLKRLYNQTTKRLLHRYRDGDSRFEGNLEDYAFFVQGLIDLYEASLDIRWLKIALELTNEQTRLFYDSDRGGFFDISGADKSILVRTKESYDGAEPSGNSIAILNLLRLSQMIGNQQYREMAEKSLAYFGDQMLNSPQALPQFLVALDFSLSKAKQIIIAGNIDNPLTKGLLQEVHSRFIPNKIILLADGSNGQETLASYVPFFETVVKINGKSTAYICEDFTCKLPTSDRSVMARILTN